MDYKEKYNKAFEVIKSLYNKTKLLSSGEAREIALTLEKNFPELTESEDERNERIRTGLIKILKTIPSGTFEKVGGITLDEGLYWLERKEYEQKFIEDWDLIRLPHVVDRKTLEDYAYQCAYDLSNDWAKDNPTWEDVKDACKLGALWLERRRDLSQEERDEMLNSIIQDAKAKLMLMPKQIDFLKTLKKQWIPTLQQLEAIRVAAIVGTANNSWAMDKLKEMYKQLTNDNLV